VFPAAGCRSVEANGARVRFVMNGEIETFHRLHPHKEAKRYQVGAARADQTRLEIAPCAM
jgi:hypothetical protein